MELRSVRIPAAARGAFYHACAVAIRENIPVQKLIGMLFVDWQAANRAEIDSAYLRSVWGE